MARMSICLQVGKKNNRTSDRSARSVMRLCCLGSYRQIYRVMHTVHQDGTSPCINADNGDSQWLSLSLSFRDGRSRGEKHTTQKNKDFRAWFVLHSLLFFSQFLCMFVLRAQLISSTLRAVSQQYIIYTRTSLTLSMALSALCKLIFKIIL